MTCPNCQLELPSYARFCAQCGTRQPNPTRRSAPGGARVGAMVLLCVGALLAGVVAAGYALVFTDPQLTAGGASRLEPGQVRTTAGFLAVAGTALVALQILAMIGLARGRDWARVLATVAAAGWAFTCIGIPLAALLLHFVWRRPRRLGR